MHGGLLLHEWEAATGPRVRQCATPGGTSCRRRRPLDIEEHDLEGTTVTRHIDGKLWELKITRHRIFYVIIVGPVMVLLHAYKKQGQKAPSRELDVGRKRMKEVLGE